MPAAPPPIQADEAVGTLLAAISFAARKHQDQRRKGQGKTPYINHPLRVLEILWDIGGVRELETLIAAVLHDTLEDTCTSAEELEVAFGSRVLDRVQEVTDDKSLPKAVRKRLQVEHAPHISDAAKLIKLADKIHNVYDVSHDPPPNWTHERIVGYINWAEDVVAGLRGVNSALDTAFDATVFEARRIIGSTDQQG